MDSISRESGRGCRDLAEITETETVASRAVGRSMICCQRRTALRYDHPDAHRRAAILLGLRLLPVRLLLVAMHRTGHVAMVLRSRDILRNGHCRHADRGEADRHRDQQGKEAADRLAGPNAAELSAWQRAPPALEPR